jgi:hypothetical protein
MIHIERSRLPSGTRAFAYHEDGDIVVQVSAELSARDQLGAIRQALRATPAAGWRSLRSPVLLPALAGCLGLRRASGSPWPHRVLVTAAVAVAVLIGVATITTVSLHSGGRPPVALQPGQPPLLNGPGPGSGQPASGHKTGDSRQPGALRAQGAHAGSWAGQPGSSPKPGKKATTTSVGGPTPVASGTPAPTTGSSPQPSPTSGPSPSPSPAPSPPKQFSGSGSCFGLLGIKICV